VNVTALNNKVGWDCTVKVLDKNGKQVGTGRTYGKSKMIELNAGTYDIEIEALKINGLQTKYMLKDIIIESGQTKEVSHSFKTGIAKIGVQSESSLVDATINIKDKKTGKHIAAGRSYTSASSNPKEFILNPGIYEVTVKTVKHEYAGKSKNMSFEVKQNETVELIVNF
jgi:Ca-activated chloride channel family protein